MDISLALGGGGARGNAHVGVIRRFEQAGYRIRAVAGTSFGGIVAAMYAAGYSPDEIEKRFAALDQSKLYGHSSHDGPSILGLAGATRALEEWLADRTFNDLKLPCALVAVDIKNGREIILKHGRVVDAILATVAVPGVFPPRLNGDHQLVDGGVLDPVPVTVARSLAPTLPVVAVVLTPMARPGMAISQLPVPIPGPLLHRITNLRLTQAFDIFLKSVDIGNRMITELRLEVDDPEVVIRPAVSEIGLLDKVDIHQIVRLGEQAADDALDDLKRAVSWPNRLRRRLLPRPKAV